MSFRVMIYGGRGALGSQCVSHFKSNDFWVGSIDFHENPEADLNVTVKEDDTFSQQETTVLETVRAVSADSKLDAVICVAGGWSGGNATNNLAKTSELMWKQSVWTSLISSTLACHHLKEGGLLVLTGAKAALESTPKMIGYGVAKAAVHHLTGCLASEDSGLPRHSLVTALLPVTLDTPMNRKWMPNGDFSTWTPLDLVADTIHDWTLGKNRPENGSLMQMITRNFNTEIIPVRHAFEVGTDKTGANANDENTYEKEHILVLE